MHSAGYFYSILWLLIFTVIGSESTSSDSSARSLDSLLQQYAFRSMPWPRTKTGIPYDACVPSNLTGITVSALMLTTHSLRWRGYGYYKEFFIPSWVIEEPSVWKLVLVYQNLANWSSFYYPLPGYTYLTPVLGILPYGAYNWDDKNVLELDILALEDPIAIKFSYVQPAQEGSLSKCVYFYSDNLVEFGNVIDENVCSTRKQGHFAIVAEVKVAPSPSPDASDIAPSPSPTADDIAPSPSPAADDNAPSPSPDAGDIAPSPSPTADDIAPSPSPAADDNAPSPTPVADDVTPSPSPDAGDDIAPSPSPTAGNVAPSYSPTIYDVTPSPSHVTDDAPCPSPTADDIAPSPSPTADDVAPSPSPTADDVAPSPSPIADHVAPTPSPAADDITPSLSPVIDDIAPSFSPAADKVATIPSPSTNDIIPSPSPVVDGIAPSHSPTTDYIAPSPSTAADQNNHQKIYSIMWAIPLGLLTFVLFGMSFFIVKKCGLLKVRQRLDDSATIVEPLLGNTDAPLP